MPAPIPNNTPLRFGDDAFTFGHDAAELQDSSPLARSGDFDALRARLEDDGYLFVRGFHPREAALEARLETLRVIERKGGIQPGTPTEDGIPAREGQSFGDFRDLSFAQSPQVLALVDGAHTIGFYEKLFGEEVGTFDKKWVRAMGRGGSNFFHYDSAYVGRGTTRRLTMWSAFSDIPLDGGPLVLCLGSHRDERLKSTYGQIDMDRDLADAVFSKSAREMVQGFGFTLATAHFEPGDALIFGLHMMHSSIPNRLDRYRISCDTRYQPASEPTDDRFHGQDGKWLGNFYNKGAAYKPMDEMRREWDLESKTETNR